MTTQSMLQTVTEHQKHLTQLAMILDQLDDVNVVLSRLKGTEKNRISCAYDPMSAAIEFITRIISDEKAKEILNQIQTTVKKSLLAELTNQGYKEEDILIDCFPHVFYLNPSFKVFYKNHRVLSFTVSSTHYSSLIKYWDVWWETDYNTVNRNIEITESKDTKNKAKKLRTLYQEKEKLEQQKQLQDSLKEECQQVHNTVSQFLETFGYQSE